MKSKNFFIVCLVLVTISVKVWAQTGQDQVVHKFTIDTLRAMSTSELVHFLNTVSYKNHPEFIPSANEAVSQIWEQALSSRRPEPASLMESINRYANNNEQYEFAVKLFERKSAYDNVFSSPRDLLVYNLEQAQSYNRVGMFHKSVTMLKKGVPKAAQFDDKTILNSYYDHLSHEYSYLSFEDTTMNNEYRSVCTKGLQLSQKLGNKSGQAIQTLYTIDQINGLDSCRKILAAAEKLIPANTIVSQHYLDNLYYIYAWLVFKKGYYPEAINTLNSLRSSNPYRDKVNTYVILAQSYYETGKIQLANEYAERAKDLYVNSKNFDEMRVALYILPDLFRNLGNHKEAYFFSQERNNNLKQQFINENLLNSEAAKFNTELKQAIHLTKTQKTLNTYLWLGLAVVVLVVVITSISIKQIRNKNVLIKDTVDQLANTNAELHVANKDLESFAYASAHDIRNPLHTISGFLQLMKIDGENAFSAESQNYLEDIELSLDKINTLIQSILKYANVNENQKIDMQPVDLNVLMQDVQTMLHSQISDNEGQVIIPRPLPTVQGVPELLSQVLLNIVSNAMKYRRKDVPPILKVTFEESPVEYKINFEDNGIGIPESAREKIFDLFSRAENSSDYDGVGVGLAVTKKIMGLHDGRIEVSNNKEHGSTFSIILPRRSQTSPSASISKSKTMEMSTP